VTPPDPHPADGPAPEETSPAEDIPAWSLPRSAEARVAERTVWPSALTPEQAWGGSDGAGVRVCILDSGVQPDHPDVGPLAEALVVTAGEGAEPYRVRPDEEGDLCGHGTACAGIVRSIAPACAISSVRVLGEGFTGTGADLIAGLRFAVEAGYDVINMSLSTTHARFVPTLHELADRAYFQRTVLVASAHNMPVDSWPWRFASVISVGSHERPDPHCLFANGQPPVEIFARGVDVEAPWMGGRWMRASGNSFATPHVSGLCALIISKHPGIRPGQVKAMLALVAQREDEDDV